LRRTFIFNHRFICQVAPLLRKLTTARLLDGTTATSSLGTVPVLTSPNHFRHDIAGHGGEQDRSFLADAQFQTPAAGPPAGTGVRIIRASGEITPSSVRSVKMSV
jgi:hypothetical protein